MIESGEVKKYNKIEFIVYYGGALWILRQVLRVLLTR